MVGRDKSKSPPKKTWGWGGGVGRGSVCSKSSKREPPHAPAAVCNPVAVARTRKVAVPPCLLRECAKSKSYFALCRYQ